jgi:hypothetical protein
VWRIEFSTDKFTPYLPEDAQQNPGAYGFELAAWLARGLAQRGMNTSYPVGEDWGWFIEYLLDGTEVMIGCSSEAKEGDGYSGHPVSWRIFVRQPKSLKQRLQRVPESPKLAELATAVQALLEREGIHVRRTEA